MLLTFVKLSTPLIKKGSQKQYATLTTLAVKYSPMPEGNQCIAKRNLEVLTLI